MNARYNEVLSWLDTVSHGVRARWPNESGRIFNEYVKPLARLVAKGDMDYAGAAHVVRTFHPDNRLPGCLQ